MGNFVILDSDNELIKRIKREANIKLAFFDMSTEAGNARMVYYINLLNIAKHLKYAYFNEEAIVEDLNVLITLVKGRPLSPLTFEHDEFYLDDNDGETLYYFNKRCEYIKKHVYTDYNSANYYNLRAYNPTIKAFYNHLDNKQINIPLGFNPIYNGIIFITKGGCITGEYIQHFKFYPKEVLDANFDVTVPIDLPITIIRDKHADLYTVDARDPNLKLLHRNYVIDIKTNDDYKGKYDIRKYIKLKK